MNTMLAKTNNGFIFLLFILFVQFSACKKHPTTNPTDFYRNELARILGQASRISGINPRGVQKLMVYMGS